VLSSVKSTLVTLSRSSTVDDLVREIFLMVHLLGVDMGRDEPMETSDSFIELYLSDNPSKRSKGVRLMSWLDKSAGIVTTKGDDFYLRSSFAFVLFVDETNSKIRDSFLPPGYSLGNKVGVLDTIISVDTFITLYNLSRTTTGNPSDNTTASPSNFQSSSQNNQRSNSQNVMVRPNSQSFSTLPN